MAYEKYTINQFMKAWFNNDYSEMSKEELEVVRTEYVDAAGLYNVDSLNKVSYIHYISNRINSIKISIKLQREFLMEFGMPYIPHLSFFRKFGHNVKWNADKIDFVKQLNIVENKEKKYIIKLESAINEFKEHQRKNAKDADVNPRRSFIKTLNVLGKSGYRIDKNETTVEELAIMISQQSEEVEILKSK
ncbi:MAG: hypothetical protein E6Q68_01655 [Polynucleobacter sp.]|nr:MAG: hypothetical protein E6Q68_01655 [Polynucleobacter sp.]